MAKRPTGTAGKPELRLVETESEIYDLMRGPQTTADRVKSLQAQAKALAAEEVEALRLKLEEVAAAAKVISEGGDAYPVGARELSSRLAEDVASKAETLRAIMSRV